MGLDDREKAFENKYSHDDEVKFRIKSRQVKLFGLWVANERGLTSETADAYARELVALSLKHPGPEPLLAKAATDLAGNPLPSTAHGLALRFGEFREIAQSQVMSEVKA